MTPTQDCGRCGTPCGSLERLACNGFDGKRFCERCWRKVGERKYLARRLKQGYVTACLAGGVRQLRVPATQEAA